MGRFSGEKTIEVPSPELLKLWMPDSQVMRKKKWLVNAMEVVHALDTAEGFSDEQFETVLMPLVRPIVSAISNLPTELAPDFGTAASISFNAGMKLYGTIGEPAKPAPYQCTEAGWQVLRLFCWQSPVTKSLYPPEGWDYYHNFFTHCGFFCGATYEHDQSLLHRYARLAIEQAFAAVPNFPFEDPA